MTRAARIRTAVVRGLAILMLTVGLPAGTAAAVTHYLLLGSAWTESGPAKPRPPAESATTAAAAPSPEPGDTDGPWRLGSCVTQQLQATRCYPGALRILGAVEDAGRNACAGVPATTQVRRSGDYTLCLTTR
ncbi:hypothetical protein ACIHFC_28915 [Streptomyces sp. NPDC052013]|uniref:hypothetical protein n=1 Tax=Streptomyces sp. NPDC052013 TaxID=3365679 RepID=UPI0037D584E3